MQLVNLIECLAVRRSGQSFDPSPDGGGSTHLTGPRQDKLLLAVIGGIVLIEKIAQ